MMSLQDSDKVSENLAKLTLEKTRCLRELLIDNSKVANNVILDLKNHSTLLEKISFEREGVLTLRIEKGVTLKSISFENVKKLRIETLDNSSWNTVFIDSLSLEEGDLEVIAPKVLLSGTIVVKNVNLELNGLTCESFSLNTLGLSSLDAVTLNLKDKSTNYGLYLKGNLTALDCQIDGKRTLLIDGRLRPGNFRVCQLNSSSDSSSLKFYHKGSLEAFKIDIESDLLHFDETSSLKTLDYKFSNNTQDSDILRLDSETIIFPKEATILGNQKVEIDTKDFQLFGNITAKELKINDKGSFEIYGPLTFYKGDISSVNLNLRQPSFILARESETLSDPSLNLQLGFEKLFHIDKGATLYSDLGIQIFAPTLLAIESASSPWSFINEGDLNVKNDFYFNHHGKSPSHFKNRGIFSAGNITLDSLALSGFDLEITDIIFKNEGVMQIEDKADLLLGPSSQVTFDSGSLSKIGSLDINKKSDQKIQSLSCLGCNLKLSNEKGNSTVRAKNFNVKNVWRETKTEHFQEGKDFFTENGENCYKTHAKYCDEVKSTVANFLTLGLNMMLVCTWKTRTRCDPIEKYCHSHLYKENWQPGLYGRISSQGNLLFDGENFHVSGGSVTASGEFNFLNHPNVFLEEHKRRAFAKVCDNGDGAALEHIKNSWGLTEHTREFGDGQLYAYRPEETLRSVAKVGKLKGTIDHLAQGHIEEYGHGEKRESSPKLQISHTQEANALVRLNENDQATTNVTEWTQNYYKDKSFIDRNKVKFAILEYKISGKIFTEVVNIEEHIKKGGIDLRMISNEDLFNPRQKLNSYKNPYALVPLLPDGKEAKPQGLEYLKLHYAVFLDVPQRIRMADFSPQNFVDELFKMTKDQGRETALVPYNYESFDFSMSPYYDGKGLYIPSIGDGFHIENLIDRLEFQTLGLAHRNQKKHLQDLQINAFKAQKKLGLTPFQKLTEEQIKKLDFPIIWPVWDETNFGNFCLGSPGGCLTWELYYTEESLNNYVESTLLDGEELVNLEVTGNVLLGELSKFCSSHGPIEMKVEGDVLNLGVVYGDSQKWDVKGRFINLGDVKTLKDLAIKALDLILSGKIESEKNIDLTAVHNAALMTLKKLADLSVEGETQRIERIALKGAFKAKGSFSVNTETKDEDDKEKGNILSSGVSVQGNKVSMKAANEMYLILLDLYGEVYRWGRDFYYAQKSLNLTRTEISAGEGGLEFESGSGMLLSGLKIDSKGNGTIHSEGGLLITSPSEYVSIVQGTRRDRGGVAGFFGGEVKTDESSYWSNPVQTILNFNYTDAANNLVGSVLSIFSKDNQTWVGGDVKARVLELRAGTPEHAAHMALLPAQNETHYKIKTETTGIDFSFKNKKLSYWKSEDKGDGNVKKDVIPTLFQVGDKFMGYVNGEWHQLSTDIVGIKEDERAKHIEIDATKINLGVAPDMETSFHYVNEKGYGIGLNLGFDEVSLESALMIEDNAKSYEKKTHKQSKMAGDFIKLNAKESIETYAILFEANEMRRKAKIILDGVAIDSLTESERHTLMKTGVKFGIKSSIGSAIENSKALIKNDYKTTEGKINAAFLGLQVAVDAMRLLAGQAFSGGVWAYSHVEESERQSSQDTKITPTVLKVGKYYHDSDTWRLEGTHISAFDAYIHTKNLEIKAAEASGRESSRYFSMDAEIPIAGSVPPNLAPVIQKGNKFQRLKMNSEIHVSGTLSLNVEGHADMRGVFIQAKNLEANFDSLTLEALESESKERGWGAHLSVNSIGGHYRNRKSHSVKQLTALLGTEKATITVAKTLKMIGAMIAHAERGDNGDITDHGNLTLKVGELYLEHIRSYDEGLTLSNALGFIEKEGGFSLSSLSASFGAHKKKQTSYATVGKGHVTVENGEIPDDLNRDVRNWQEDKTYYRIEPIHVYLPSPEYLKELYAQIPKNPDGGIDWLDASVNSGKSLYRALEEGFGPVFEGIKWIFEGMESCPAKDDFLNKEEDICDAHDSENELKKEEVPKKKVKINKEKLAENIQEKLKDQNIDYEKWREEVIADERLSQSEREALLQFSYTSEEGGRDVANKLLEEAFYKIAESGENARLSQKPDISQIYVLKELARLSDENILVPYKDFIEKYPHLSKYGPSLLRISAGFLFGGPPGALSVAAVEAFSHALGEMTSEPLEKGLKKSSEILSQMTSGDLTDNEINTILTTALLLSSGRIKSHSPHSKMGNAKKDVFDNFEMNSHLKDSHVLRYVKEELPKNKDFLDIANTWGMGTKNTNQLLEHTLGKFQDPKRLPGLERRAGLKPGSLSDVYSGDTHKVLKSIKNFNDLADNIRKNPTDSVVLEGGHKKVYWKQAADKPQDGIALMEFDGKKQTLMSRKRKDFEQKDKISIRKPNDDNK